MGWNSKDWLAGVIGVGWALVFESLVEMIGCGKFLSRGIADLL
jgi:hypothetical protein